MTIEKVQAPLTDRQAWIAEMVADIVEMEFEIRPESFWIRIQRDVAEKPRGHKHWDSVQSMADMHWLNEEINRNVSELDPNIGFDPGAGLFEEESK